MGHRQSRDARVVDTDTRNMPNVISLNQIPTLRYLYASGALRIPSSIRFVANDRLLDRVSLMYVFLS